MRLFVIEIKIRISIGRKPTEPKAATHWTPSPDNAPPPMEVYTEPIRLGFETGGSRDVLRH